MRPMRAVWVLPSLAGGGAERAVATLLTHLNQNKITPMLVLLRAEGVFLNEVEAAGIPIVDLAANGRFSPYTLRQLTRTLRQLQPDATIGVLRTTGLLTAVAHRRAGSPGRIYLNEQNIPSADMRQHGRYPLKRTLIRPLYRLPQRIIAISTAVATDLHQTFNVPPQRVTVIPNPVNTSHIHALASQPADHPWLNDKRPLLVSVGRLHPQKGHDILIHAFAHLHQQIPQARLLIIGAGPEHAHLQSLISNLQLQNHAQLLGFQPNPYPFMRRASLFVLASRYEGFGIVLAEALTLGTPIVATNCPGAPAEILAQGAAGRLVPPRDATALAHAMLKTLRQPAPPPAPHFAQRYEARTIAQQYEHLLQGERT